ncbi:MAG: hypothetical protein GF331_18765 [Chitinivibrionales bacterium]|nr:hypothetical protein [Chitinivibrionales bacterium]
MARRKRTSHTLDLRSRSRDELERYARSKLDAGKPRQARDAYKELVRLDPERYTPDLLHCYLAQARQMAAAGQLTEAGGLLDFVRDMDSAGRFSSELAECRALIAGERGARASGTPVRRSAGRRAAAAGAAIPAADAAVCLDQQVESPAQSFVDDLARIRSALERITQSDFDGAIEQVRPIGVASEFRDWKLLVRGMVAFYRGEDSKCLANLERISESSAASRTALPYRVLYDESGTLVRESSRKEPLVADACRVAGEGRAAAELARAEYLWMTGRYRDAYRRLRGRLSGFPSFQSDLPGVLTRMLYNLPHHLEPAKANAYVEGLQRELAREDVEPHPIELYQMTRAMGLLMGESVCDSEDCALLEENWEPFLALCRRMFGEDTQLEGEVHAYIGRQCARDVEPDPFPFTRSRRPSKDSVLDAGRAEKHLAKSLELDPENRLTWTTTLDFYERTGCKAERNRVLDRAIEQFPDDKEILHKAAMLCFERSADKKGLGYLERAHALDPLDRTIRTTLLRQYVSRAADLLSRGRPKQMRELMDRAEAVSEAQTRAYDLGRRYVLARRAAMEDGAGDHDSAKVYLTRAYAEDASSLELTYFALLAGYVYGGSKALTAGLERRLSEALIADAGMPAVARLAAVLTYMRHNERPRELVQRAEQQRISGLAARAIKSGFVRSAAVRISRYAIDVHDLDLAKRYAAAGLRADGNDLFFRVLKLVARKPFHFRKQMAWAQRVQHLQLKATERDDQEAVALAQEALADVDVFGSLPPGFFESVLEEYGGGTPGDDDEGDEPPPRRRRGRRKRQRSDEGEQLDLF